MKKAELYCKNNKFFAYKAISLFSSIRIHGFEYGIDDYIIGSIEYGLNQECSYFRRKIEYNSEGEAYFRSKLGRMYISEFMRV